MEQLTAKPYLGGEISLSEEGREVVYADSYIIGEETESDLEYHYTYFMTKEDYEGGFKKLKKEGFCSIPIFEKKIWYESRLNPPKDSIDMRLQDDGTIVICGKKTPWTLDKILITPTSD